MSAYSPKIQTPYKLAKKSEIIGRVEDGKLFDAFYDTEFTDLNKRFAEITEFGGAITDLAGNVLYLANHNGRISDYTLASPYAWVIQRMHEKDDKKGDPQYVMAGKIMQFFRYASHLDEAPFADQFLKMCKKGSYKNADGTRSTYYAYPVEDDNGNVDWDFLRIHGDLKKFYYKDPKRDEWIKKDIYAQTIGYNNINADDQLIWTCLHMAAAENIFITHLPRLKKSRLDMLRVVEAAVAAGPKGESGVKPAYKTDPRTGESVLTFSQGDIIKANTGVGNALRGLLEGVTMPDGSYVDFDQLHGAFKDALALAGLTQYVRRQAPDIMSQMEKNTDWKNLVARLSEKQGRFGNHPIMSYVHKTYPYISGRMVTLIGTDQYRHNPKVALIFNLGIDPETYSFNGKTLKELTPHEHAELIKAGKKNQNGIYKIVRTHHCPALLDEDVGFAAGFNNGLEKPDLHRRAKYLRDPQFIENAMEGLRLAMPRLGGPERLTLPQAEEELFTFPTLEMHDPEAGEDVQIHRAQNHVEAAAQNARRQPMKVKGLWFRAIEPSHNIFIKDFHGDYDAENSAAEDYERQIKKLNTQLSRANGPLLPSPDELIIDKRSAMKYRIKLLFFARNNFQKGHLKDLAHHFRIEDSSGHHLSEKEINNWPMRKLDTFRQSGNLNIVHETLNVSVPVIDRIIEQLGYADLLGAKVKNQLEAVKTHRHNGTPSLNRKDRWLTLSEARKQLNKIRNNELMDEDIRTLEKYMPGLWTSFMTQHADAQASLNAYEKYLEDKENKYGLFMSAQKELVGIDAETCVPIENIEYKIKPDRIFKVPVPDRYLENPPIDPVRAKPLWILGLKNTFNKQSLTKALKDKKDIVLVGEKTGKYRHLAKAEITDAPLQGGIYARFYTAAKARYNESGSAFPKPDQSIALFGEGPYELHNLHSPDPDAQTLHVPKTHFESLLNHKLASLKTQPGGMIVRDDGLNASNGDVRLLEIDPHSEKPSGWEIKTTITSAKRLSITQLAKLPDQDAKRYGFNTTEEMLNHASSIFADFKLKPDDQNNKLWVIDFGKIDAFDQENATAFFNPARQKTSAVITNDQHNIMQI